MTIPPTDFDSRTHVFRDLRPYVCTIEDCPEAGQQYDSLDDWVGHEASVHLAMDGQSEFPSNPSRVSSQVRDCQFCQRQNVSIFHVAHHLRRIACFSLPRSSGNDGSASSDKEVSHGAHIDSDSSVDLSIGSVYDDQVNLDDADLVPALEQIRIPKGAGDDNTTERILDGSLWS